MGAMKSLATEADYASVLAIANRFKAEADQLREVNAEMLEALKLCRSALAMLTDPHAIDSSTPQQAWAASVEAEVKSRNVILKAEGR